MILLIFSGIKDTLNGADFKDVKYVLLTKTSMSILKTFKTKSKALAFAKAYMRKH